ncbi:MAG: nucleoside deaminase [Patescibacteria group bacterium]
MDHEKHIKRCIELSKKALERGDNPFGALIANEEGVLVESENKIKENDVTNHAEIMVMRKAQKMLETDDLSDYTIYSNCEPCPMCSFMMRELKFKRVVFAIPSPYMGGYNKWNILEDKDLLKFEPIFTNPPEIIAGLLKEEATEVFEKAGWSIQEGID